MLSVVPAFAESCADLVPKLISESNLFWEMNALGDGLREASDATQPEGGMTVEDRDRIRKALSETFQAVHLNEAVRMKLVNACDAKLFADALKEMDSPTFQKFRQLDADSYLPENRVRQQRFIRAVAMQSPRESRVKLIDQVLDATGELSFASEAQAEVTIQMLSAAFRSAPSKQQEEALRGETRAMAQRTSEACLLFTYRTVSDEDLAAFAKANMTPAMRRFNAAAHAAMLDVIRSDARQLGVKIRDAALAAKSHS